jgi:acyl-coenzyme A synthetase/AMP-(fatty) acid ligase
MSGAISWISPRYIRLSGEISDQGILDALRAAFPNATVGHAFATTEAGVGFEVQDGRAGFPAELADMTASEVQIDVAGGTLRLRSPGNAVRYVGTNVQPLKSEDGFVDTGDQLELRSGRYHFVGRSGGVINVGGLKVHPEEVEAVINSHPRVRMSRVAARRSPITGAIVAAEVVIKDGDTGPDDSLANEQLKHDITTACRGVLAAHKVPVTIKFVASLEVSPSGKLLRPHA